MNYLIIFWWNFHRYKRKIQELLEDDDDRAAKMARYESNVMSGIVPHWTKNGVIFFKEFSKINKSRQNIFQQFIIKNLNIKKFQWLIFPFYQDLRHHWSCLQHQCLWIYKCSKYSPKEKRLRQCKQLWTFVAQMQNWSLVLVTKSNNWPVKVK